MANPFVHVELETTDVRKAKDFYGKLFDWKLEDVPMGDGSTYTMIRVGDGTGGGLMKNPMPDPQSMWLAYVLVDDINEERALALGEHLIAAIASLYEFDNGMTASIGVSVGIGRRCRGLGRPGLGRPGLGAAGRRRIWRGDAEPIGQRGGVPAHTRGPD